jgi:hypothetical protein
LFVVDIEADVEALELLIPLATPPIPIIKFKFYLNVTFPSILIISYIKTVSLPADPSRFGFFNRVHQRPHPVGVCRVGLHQVDYIEAVCVVLPSVLDFEIVPLSESTSPIIIFEIQIILEVATIINFS